MVTSKCVVQCTKLYRRIAFLVLVVFIVIVAAFFTATMSLASIQLGTKDIESMTISHGIVPQDGFLGSAFSGGYRFRPNLKDGQRLSGTVTISPVAGAPAGVTYRMLVDGIPQPSNAIDTTQWSDGTHVIAFQVMDTAGLTVHNGSQVVVINNGSAPFTSLEGQAIVGDVWNGTPPNSLAWARIDVTPNAPYPLDPQIAQHPKAVTDADRQRLATEKIWWVEGISHQGTSLWQSHPIVMKNAHGDLFIKHWNPQGGGSGVTPSSAKPYVEAAPAYDGPRGIGFLNPYASLSPFMNRRLASGEYGWIGVEKSGRVVTVDITGKVNTILGPRSVAGVSGTDPDELTVTLAHRLANGEKEYIGDDNGLPLSLPHDLWPCSSFPFEGMIADTGNNRVVEIMFDEHNGQPGSRLMRSWPLLGVTSVCDSLEMQQSPDINIIWVAVNPEGLWCQRHTVGVLGQNPGMSGGADGSFTGHNTTLEKLADIPKAFWVRVLGHRIFVFTTDLGIYEYDSSTGVLTERLARRALDETYVFANIDENGTIGPKDRIYWGSASMKNGGYGSSKTVLFWIDPHTWQTGQLSPLSLINKVIYGNWTSLIDPFGHYIWGVAIHPELPKFMTCGISSSSWFLWTGCLGETPVADPIIPYDGTVQWRNGNLDEYLGIGSFFGYMGHGSLGLSCDLFRDYKTYADASDAIHAILDPMFPSTMSEANKESVCKQLFAQRTRRHYQDVEPIVIPDPEPDPEPEPDPDPITLNGVSISGGTPPYSITITDAANTIVTVNGIEEDPQ